MERQISDRSLVNLLFKTIKEFYLKSENIVSDCKKYDRCRLISTLLSLVTLPMITVLFQMI